jgi:hypothetical protein
VSHCVDRQTDGTALAKTQPRRLSLRSSYTESATATEGGARTMARSSPLSRRAPPAAPKSWHAVHCLAHLEQPLPRTTVDSIGHSDASRSIDRSNSQHNTTRNRLSTRCNAAAAERAPHCAPDASQHVCFRARRRIAHQRSPVVCQPVGVLLRAVLLSCAAGSVPASRARSPRARCMRCTR